MINRRTIVVLLLMFVTMFVTAVAGICAAVWVTLDLQQLRRSRHFVRVQQHCSVIMVELYREAPAAKDSDGIAALANALAASMERSDSWGWRRMCQDGRYSINPSPEDWKKQDQTQASPCVLVLCSTPVYFDGDVRRPVFFGVDTGMQKVFLRPSELPVWLKDAVEIGGERPEFPATGPW